MAILVLAKNVWWSKMSREEQEEYLREHPRSRLKITKRRKRKAKFEPEPESEAESEEEPQSEEPTDSSDEEKEQELLSPGEGFNLRPVELNVTEQEAAANYLQQELADKLEPGALLEGMDDEDQQEVSDALEKAVQERNPKKRATKFLYAATKFAVKAGLITAAVAVTGSISPHVLFLPSVYTSIWHTSTDWSEGTASTLEKAVNSLHKVMKSGAKRHVKRGYKTGRN